jgi:hypothetical protein
MKSNFFSCKTQHTSQGNNSNKVDYKDSFFVDSQTVESNSNRRSNQQDINPRIEDRPLYLIPYGERFRVM